MSLALYSSRVRSNEVLGSRAGLPSIDKRLDAQVAVSMRSDSPQSARNSSQRSRRNSIRAPRNRIFVPSLNVRVAPTDLPMVIERSSASGLDESEILSSKTCEIRALSIRRENRQVGRMPKAMTARTPSPNRALSAARSRGAPVSGAMKYTSNAIVSERTTANRPAPRREYNVLPNTRGAIDRLPNG